MRLAVDGANAMAAPQGFHPVPHASRPAHSASCLRGPFRDVPIFIPAVDVSAASVDELVEQSGVDCCGILDAARLVGHLSPDFVLNTSDQSCGSKFENHAGQVLAAVQIEANST